MTTIAACKQSLPGLAWQTDADGSVVGRRMGFREWHKIKVWTIDGHWQAEWYRLPDDGNLGTTETSTTPGTTETTTNRQRSRLLWAVSQRIEREAQDLASLAGLKVCW